MTVTTRPEALVLSVVPPDLRAALAKRCALVTTDALTGWPAAPAPGIRIAVTTSMHGVDRATFDALPDLEIVICNGAGLDRIDLAEAARRKIAICNTPDELADDVGEAAIALTYAIMRRVAEADRFVRAGRWTKDRMPPSTRVAGKVMGIVGFGKIGRRVARLAEGIGMQIRYHGPRVHPDVSYSFVADLNALAQAADVLAISCPGGEATRHIVNSAVLEQLGPNGYLINVSRGSTVDEAALIDALRHGKIAGAGLDVFATEPNLDPRLLEFDNVVLQPHSASITHETRAAMIARLMRELGAFLAKA
jgi:hydroxypyruvate reductase